MNALRRLGEALFLVGLLAFGLAWLLSCYGHVVTPLFWVGGVTAVAGVVLHHTFDDRQNPPPHAGRPPDREGPPP